MKSKQVCKKLFGIFFALLLLVSAIMSGRVILPAFAAEKQYTGVLQDLQKDSEFDTSAYPDKSDDFSIQVIQIAESTDGELFVYTYQPCQKTTYLLATEVNMSLLKDFDEEFPEDNSGDSDGNDQGNTDEDNDGSSGGGGFGGGGFGGGGGSAISYNEEVAKTHLYDLTLLKSDGVFCKYLVNDLKVSSESIRYYNISSIYRAWLKGIDKETGNDNVKDAVAFAVGRLYVAKTENGVVSYACEERQTIRIENPVAGYLEYSDGFKFCPTWCDRHYIAFSTDWDIDYLKSADVSYVSRLASASYGLGLSGKPNYGEPKKKEVTLNGTQVGGNPADGWFGYQSKFEWERIQSINEFLNETGNILSDSAKEKLNGAQWVLNFCETQRSGISTPTATVINWTDVSEVTVLRLEFVKNNKVYNLGAVSDKVTEPDSPDNPTIPTNDKSFWEYVWECIVKLFQGKANFVETLVAIVAILVVLVLLPVAVLILSLVFPAFGAVVKLIFKGIWAAFVWVCKGLWWLICLPFKGIAALVRKIRGE